jgi:hypothetical protein
MFNRQAFIQQELKAK